MFGISFSELLLVGLVALLVLGPERLPGAARTAGLWIGRLKRNFNNIKRDIEREVGADDIRRQLHNEHILHMEERARRILDPKSAPRADATTVPGEQSASTPVQPDATTGTPVAATGDSAGESLPTPAPTPAPVAPTPSNEPPRTP